MKIAYLAILTILFIIMILGIFLIVEGFKIKKLTKRKSGLVIYICGIICTSLAFYFFIKILMDFLIFLESLKPILLI